MDEKEQMAYEMDIEKAAEPETPEADGGAGRPETGESGAGIPGSGTDTGESARDEEESKRRDEKKGRKSGYKLTGSFGAKLIAVLLMLLSAVACAGGGVACYVAWDMEMYTSSFATVQENVLKGQGYRIASDIYNYLNNGYGDSARQYLDDRNAEVAITRFEEALASDSSVFLWQSYEPEEAMGDNGFYSSLHTDFEMPMPLFNKTTGEEAEDWEQMYTVRVFFDPDFPLDDDIRVIHSLTKALYEARYDVIGVCAGCGVLFLLCLIFLLCGAGHKNGKEGIVPGILTGIPFDVLTCALFLVEMGLIQLMNDVLWYALPDEVCYALVIAVVIILGICYLLDLAIRLKMGRLWEYTLVFIVFRGVWRGLRVLGKLLLKVPTVWLTVITYIVVCILEGLLNVLDGGYYYPEVWFLWFLEKLVLFGVVLYIALTCKRLLRASRELAEGHEEYRVDTKYMFGDFREQGENLNSLGQGISKAVAERLKSERLKTELITNVSHDLKTPLTSIINYAELIRHEETENARITEYSEVLLRQSDRLRKLLENLVEASKATTGNLEVQLTPCEAGVLLTQAVGEYQQRMEEKSLELRVSQPEEPVRILADGRHLWRVFDNLLSNICKYAQENTRVYLTLEQKEDSVFIVFRNMSKYALNISPEELEERFVRGDRSRHMEGNGLGLSIAKNLTELQNGKMDIVVDGDLFKVTLTFDALRED